MADQRDGGIAWTDATWNPVRGCSRVSEGCRNCYAESVARRFSGPGQPYEGLVEIGAKGARWNGTTKFVTEHLADPLRWKRPRRVFVNSMSDLFHESLTNEEIAAVFGVMASAPHHTFQVLTKRPERMRDWFAWIANQAVSVGGPTVNAARGVRWYAWQRIDDLMVHDAEQPWIWPLPNVWLGVSVEDQKSADDRIPLLLETPAAVRWVSYEPAIEAVDFDGLHLDDDSTMSSFRISDGDDGLDWIVVGGESGPGARPFDLAWARSVIAQARGTGCSVFVKQLGAKPMLDGESARYSALPPFGGEGGPITFRRIEDRKGGDPNEWPEDLRVREFPEVSRG